MSSSAGTSFVNIDLDETNPEPETSHNDSVEENSTSENDTTQVDKPVTEKMDKITKNNEHLERLAQQLMDDYSKYYRLNPSSQIDELNECMDNLLTHMEEFYGLIEMIRNDSVCLEELSLSVQSKISQCKDLFRMIDKLERIVRHVSMQLSLMENEVIKAEKMMGRKNPVKRLLSLISNQSNSNSTRYDYVPPDIFKTDDVMKL